MLASYYRAAIRLGFQASIQYRGAVAIGLFGFFVEPAIYLVVWTTVAESQGGTVSGFTVGGIAAYYIVWTLVRVYNLAFAPYAWESRIQRGRLNDFLSLPHNPFHRDFCYFAGTKFTWTIFWIPVAFGLSWAFKPDLSPGLVEIVAFVVALWGAFLLRFVMLYLFGMITFWTTRGSAIFEILVAGELVLSGRLVPLEFMPDAVQSVAAFMPYKWTFQFPIDVLIGRSSAAGMVSGIGAQLAWAAGLGVIYALVWRRAIRRYTAVGACAVPPALPVWLASTGRWQRSTSCSTGPTSGCNWSTRRWHSPPV